MTFLLFSVEEIEELHADQLRLFGGSAGLRDRGLLESAVARPEHLAYYNQEATLGEIAATLGWGLIKNHAFIDGNKRIGLNAMVVLLAVNGHRFVCSEEEQEEWVLKAAASECSEEHWTAWVSDNIAPVSWLNDKG